MNAEHNPQPLISVILPVYNVAPYIDKCLDSLVNQTLFNIEFLFFDDWGTDGSIDKVRQAAVKDKRIRIFKNPKNMGPGYPRSEGLKKARGEYVAFIDSDDWLDKDFFEKLYRLAKAKNLDVAKGNVVYEYPEYKKVPNQNRRIRLGRLMGKPLVQLYTCYFWDAIYRRSFLEKHLITFYPDRFANDTIFLNEVMSKNPKLGMTNSVFHHYVQNPKSLTHTPSEKQSTEIIQSCVVIMRNIDKTDIKNTPYLQLLYKHHTILIRQFHEAGNLYPKLQDFVVDCMNEIFEKSPRQTLIQNSHLFDAALLSRDKKKIKAYIQNHPKPTKNLSTFRIWTSRFFG